MVDTPRTRSSILSLFADNTTGDISPQDLRDFVVSIAFYELTAEETAAGVTPTDYRYPVCNVKRYGAVGDGVTDDLTAFQNAVACAGSSTSQGNRIIIPFGRYFLNGTWGIDKDVLIEGNNGTDHHLGSAAELIFPSNTDGIRVYNGNDSPSTPQEGTHTIIRNVALYCNAAGVSGRGIYATTTIHLEYVSVRSFSGIGIEFYGDTTNGIADNWWMTNVFVRDCLGDGFYVHGPDAQVGTAINCQFLNNGGWGVKNEAYYTNIFIGCQSSGNTSGAFYDPGADYQGLILIGCYVESGATANTSLDDGSIMLACSTVGWDYRGGFFGNMAPGVGIAVPLNGIICFCSTDGANNRVEKFRLDTQTQYVTGPIRYTVGSYGTVLSEDGLVVSHTGTADHETFQLMNNSGTKVGHINTSGSKSVFYTQANSTDGYYGQDSFKVGNLASASESTQAVFYNTNGTVGTIKTNGTQTIFYPNSGTSGSFYADTSWRITTAGTADTAIASFVNGNGEVGSIHTSGSATAYNTSSDYRLKDNITPYHGALNVVEQLNPVSFTWKSDGTPYIGFLAHEVQEHIPFAVSGEKDGDTMQGIDPSKLVAHLVGAIKELSARVKELEEKWVTGN